MKNILSFFIIIISLNLQAQYKEYAYGTPYRIGDTVQVSSKNSLFKAVKSFTAYSIPSDNQYWDFAGAMSDAKIRELDARLKAAEAEIVKQKSTNLLFSESIAAIEDKLDAAPVPDPSPTPTTGYLSLPLSTAIVVSGKTNIVIENVRFENTASVSLYISSSSGITVKNCFFNKSASESIVVENSKNITIQNCLFNGATCGVYATTSQAVKVTNNQFVNMRMRADNSSRGQFVQFNTVTGAGNEISENEGENFAGESNPEDMISLYKSSGTASSPILVKNNKGRGGGPSLSGGGIVAGDYGGDYIRIENNHLVNPGNYGIAVAGGNYNVLNNNRVYSDFHSYNNAGVIIWAQGGVSCSNITYTNNHVNWPYKLGGLNNAFIEGNCGALIQSGNVFNESLSAMMPDFPVHLIDFITPTELLKIRGKVN